jgi:2-polyprenyl-3-methyl-5-hydroxy-6-metoxy-1,4-benzoquinol methylase
MESQHRKDHWEQVYATRPEQELSWFEPLPALSLEMIRKSARDKSVSIVDIGGGNSRLVDCLLAEGYDSVAVVDVSSKALAITQSRLGDKAATVQWIESDVLEWQCSSPFDIWHDRAVYHFLTDAADRARYTALASSAVKSGGSLIVATFALDGPRSCSGLPVYRASSETIAADFAPLFELTESIPHEHTTPSGNIQRFQVSRLRRK